MLDDERSKTSEPFGEGSPGYPGKRRGRPAGIPNKLKEASVPEGNFSVQDVMALMEKMNSQQLAMIEKMAAENRKMVQELRAPTAEELSKKKKEDELVAR